MKYQTQIALLYFRKTILFLSIVFLHFSTVYGQNLKEIDVHFETDSVAIVKGTTFTNFLVVKNTSTAEITIQDLAPQEKYPGLLFYPKTDFTLTTGEQKRLPLKFIANLDVLKMQSDKITFTLSYQSSSIVKNLDVSFNIQKEEDRSIAIYPFSRENYLHTTSPQSAILIFVENRGYSKRNIKLDFQSLPEGLEISPKQQTVSLEGLDKQMVEIIVSTRKENILFPEYNIQVKATDLIDNKDVGSSQINLVFLSSNRQVVRGIDSRSSSNFAEIAYNENGSGFNYLQLKGNTEFLATENLYGRFNFNTDYYQHGGLYNLYDTWLELEHKKSVFRIGNVQGSDYDYSVSGRGGKLATKIGANNALEVFALENNYSLYSTYFSQFQGSQMAGAKYNFGKAKSFKGKISYLFDHDPRRSINSQVGNFITSFSLLSQHNFRLEAGVSTEKGLVNKDQNTGASAGLNYDIRIGGWDFQSLNSYASKSYAGLNRGSFSLNQRIGHIISDNKRAFLLYKNSQVQPEYLSFQDANQTRDFSNHFHYFHSTQAVKMGYQFSIQNWSFLLSPQVELQKSENNFSDRELLSYRLQTNVGTSFGDHGLHLTSEYSYSKADKNLDWFHSLRSIMSYRFKGFSLNGTAQWNPINVIDMNSYQNTDLNFVNYNLYTTYNFDALPRAFTGSVSAGINYSELYQNINNNISGNIEYILSNGWSATGYFNYSNFRSTQTKAYRGNNYQVRLGLKKYFTVAISIGKHKVSLQLFEDKNFNGTLDSGEPVRANEVVKLDNFVAMTDDKGKVTFQNVPQGSYKLTVNESAGSRMMMDPTIVVNRNMNIKVGLVKNIRVTGKLVEIRQAYDVLETSATGIMVYAQNEDGVVQTAVVNQNNEFEFFLKDGIYDIYIENDKYNYINPKQTIEVNNTDYSESLLFEYKKKDTTIKVKKF